ncbi:hypothetical protein GCK32_021633 [Trichostrongylus colubriformis]|uniref:Uncharacterized protein n=1 Tax=Trichostrongylus colubriformis TaxID=6319 RepID=A0AAN8FHB5_TRICO
MGHPLLSQAYRKHAILIADDSFNILCISGSLEFTIDVSEQYPHDDSYHSVFGPLNRIFFAVYDITPFAAILFALTELLHGLKGADVRFSFN